ncbi:hypothetical protein [Mucilaginibacter sp.]|uniref:hypothetical protein n=1 Tax=Mucilaginibacter sp. TaxID=1882438 RepID=UPI00260A05F6|nr:hypothetical protein [Mucilaginibacter sp.]MDB4926530.1 hypothetical protein [Mucilaginibacter sp.]
MKFKMKLADGTTQIIQITADYFKTWRVWRVQVNGKVAMLYKLGNEWMQRHEDYLDARTLLAIGNYIDSMLSSPDNASFA